MEVFIEVSETERVSSLVRHDGLNVVLPVCVAAVAPRSVGPGVTRLVELYVGTHHVIVASQRAVLGQRRPIDRAKHRGDVWPGQSGGPFFAWWEGEDFPRVVCVQSGQDSDENSASGGAHMVNCIVRALNAQP